MQLSFSNIFEIALKSRFFHRFLHNFVTGEERDVFRTIRNMIEVEIELLPITGTAVLRSGRDRWPSPCRITAEHIFSESQFDSILQNISAAFRAREKFCLQTVHKTLCLVLPDVHEHVFLFRRTCRASGKELADIDWPMCMMHCSRECGIS